LTERSLSTIIDRELRISRRLTHLYATVPELSDERVARRLSELENPISVTPQYIQQLRTGNRTNPTINVVYGLAEVCGVPATYLIADEEEAKRIDDQLALLAALKKAGVSALALRAAELDGEARRWVMEQVERERRRAKVPPSD
jgi:transcriptional regulator with XRE-family HTH domain